jgi:Rhodopirellula transposase DDE domain
VIVQTIAATTTRTGLSVHAALDTNTYPTGIKIPDTQLTALHDTGTLHPHTWNPEWNYTLNPTRSRAC